MYTENSWASCSIHLGEFVSVLGGNNCIELIIFFLNCTRKVQTNRKWMNYIPIALEKCWISLSIILLHNLSAPFHSCKIFFFFLILEYVKDHVIKKLIPTWFENCERDYLKLLKLFYVESFSLETASSLLICLFKWVKLYR